MTTHTYKTAHNRGNPRIWIEGKRLPCLDSAEG